MGLGLCYFMGSRERGLLVSGLLTLLGSMSLGFSRLSSFKRNSLDLSSQIALSSPFSQSFCWESQSGW